jgi:hypothetical protein
MSRRRGEDVFVADCALGRGLFAARAFAAGETILRLSGPPYGREDPIHATAEGANLLQTGRLSYIMLEPPAVYANHSCDPNAGVARRRLVAIRPIAAGEEIRFDYSTTMAEDDWTLPCRCGAAGCRGLVTDFRLLPADVRTRYLALGVVPGFIARSQRQLARQSALSPTSATSSGHRRRR